ncbi:hypothetical protein VPHK436_0043 [Vibrio phage K436]
MGFIKDAWDDITGKTAADDAAKQAEKDRLQAANDAASARVFAETEGAGRGSIGEVSLSLDDEDVDTKVKKSSNLYL